MRIRVDIPFLIDEICSATGARPSERIDKGTLINTICTDTRECEYGDLFIALSGEKESGEKYINDALYKGCIPLSTSAREDVLTVRDTADALLNIAKTYKIKVAPIYTVAVTGSVGKSTTVKFLSKILREKYRVHSTPGNFNNHIGLPISVLSMPLGTELCILEIGMNHKGEISHLSKAVNADLGIITGIGTAHIGNLGSREEIAKAKLEIRDGIKSGTVLLPYGEALLDKVEGGIYAGRNSDLSDFSLDNDGEALSFRSPNRRIHGIEFFSRGEHLLSNLALTISAADILGLSEEEIIKGVRAITPEDLRQRFIVLKDFTVFDDSYNASLESVDAALKSIVATGKPTGAFLGDVLELGREAAAIHEKIGQLAASYKIGHLYLYGNYAEYIARGAVKGGMNKKDIYINTGVDSPEISINQIEENHVENEIILFKASHKMRLDRIADLIKERERNGNEYK